MSSQENIYELLYMIRLEDDWALKTFFQHFERLLHDLVGKNIYSCPSLCIYEEDMLQEARIALYEACEGYREDRGASFQTFATLVVKRKIWKLVEKYHSTTTVQLHRAMQVSEENYLGDWYDFFESKDRLSDPVYYTQYRVAEENLLETVHNLNEKEHETLDAWMSCDCYEDARQMLHLTRAAYSGRLDRLKRKIRKSIFQDGMDSE